jgi:hypothetical protein
MPGMNDTRLRRLMVDFGGVIAARVRRGSLQTLLVGVGCDGVLGLLAGRECRTLGVAQGCDKSHRWC